MCSAVHVRGTPSGCQHVHLPNQNGTTEGKSTPVTGNFTVGNFGESMHMPSPVKLHRARFHFMRQLTLFCKAVTAAFKAGKQDYEKCRAILCNLLGQHCCMVRKFPDPFTPCRMDSTCKNSNGPNANWVMCGMTAR